MHEVRASCRGEALEVCGVLQAAARIVWANGELLLHAQPAAQEGACRSMPVRVWHRPCLSPCLFLLLRPRFSPPLPAPQFISFRKFVARGCTVGANEGKVKNGEYYALFAAASGKKEVLLGDTTFFVRFQDEGKLPVSMSMSVRSRCALAWIGKDSGEVKRERDSPQPLSSKRWRGRQQSASASVSVSAADLKCPVDDSIKLCERNIVAVHDQLRELHGHRKRAFPLFHSP
jgi:hypothetical protein